MKYNLGCGNDYREGWINVDCEAQVAPDVVCDLSIVPWPFENDTADEVVVLHLLDEMLTTSGGLRAFMHELYRICRNGAKITIRNTDPRHGDVALVPRGHGGISAAAFQSYDLAVVEDWISRGLRHTPTSLYDRIDFAGLSLTRFLDEPWLKRWQSGAINDEALTLAVQAQNNVVATSEVVLSARKPFAPGRSLAQCDALVLVRRGGLGDVLMALSACRAIKALSDRPIYLLTVPAYQAFAELCPHLDRAFTDEGVLRAHARALGLTNLKVVDLSAVRFGLSRLHEVDAFLQALSIAPPNDAKGLEIDLSGLPQPSPALARLAVLPPSRKRIILHPGLSDPSRTWPIRFWHDLADHCLAEGHCVVVIGSSHGQDNKSVAKLDDPRIIDLSDQLDLAASLQVMRACDLLISADSGPIQLAGASDIAIIGLYSVVGGEKRLPYRSGSLHHKAVGLMPECTFSPCYRWMSDPSTQAQFLRVSGVLQTDLNAFFARWCVNPNTYACVREASMTDKVKAFIPAMLQPVRPSPGIGPMGDR